MPSPKSHPAKGEYRAEVTLHNSVQTAGSLAYLMDDLLGDVPIDVEIGGQALLTLSQ
jgi:hypothetical protein